MVLRRPPPGKDWEPFWGCNRFPKCRSRVQLFPEGTAETDDELDLDYDMVGEKA